MWCDLAMTNTLRYCLLAGLVAVGLCTFICGCNGTVKEEPVDSKLCGFWHGSESSPPGGKTDPIATAMSKQSFLVLWPDGRYDLYIGLGIITGKWASTADELTLTPEVSASRAWPRTIQQETNNSATTFKFSSDGSIVSTSEGQTDQKGLRFTR